MNPPLRFSTTEDWTECQLKDICEINPSAEKMPDTFQYIDLESVTNGRLLQTIPCCKSSAPSRARRILSNEDVLFQTVRPYQKNNYFFKSDSNTSVVASTGYAQLRCSSNSAYFLYTLIHTDSFVNQVLQKCTGGAYPAITASSLSTVKINIPVVQEQQKIASFFSTLDQKIELNERKLEALEKLKKGVMQKIFDHEFSFKDKEGKKFPEWKKTYLKDILLFQNGINTGKENFGTGIKLISVNEVLSPFPIKYDDISSSVMVDDEVGKKFSVTYGDVLFQRSSETREDAGTSNVYIDNIREAVFGGFVIRGKRIGDYNPIFLHELLRSPKVRQQIIKYAQGAQHINIGQESLEKIEIKLPCREEQENIAELAIALYKKIELLTNKVKRLKNLKKGFMQQMFV
jgi:type I restriction enzyme S subunit